MIDRRSFMLATALGTVGANLPPAVRAAQNPADPLRGMLVINALGNLDNPYGIRPAGDTSLISRQALADAHASGLTAVNITISSSDNFEETVSTLAQYEAFVRDHSAQISKILTVRDLGLAREQNKIGLIYGFQNAAMLGDRLERVELFANLGIRIIQLTYNAPNQLGGGSLAPGDPGLTPFGHQVVEALNQQRVMVDLSHSGHQICVDAARASKRPISINHTGCKALADVPRNKTDEELRLVAEKGGFVGIYFMPFLAPGRSYTSADVVAHIDHAIRICGEDHVGIGTDYGIIRLGDMTALRAHYADMVNQRRAHGISAPGEDPRFLPYADDLTGPDQFRTLAARLAERGYTQTRIEKLMGQNFLRFAQEIWGT